MADNITYTDSGTGAIPNATTIRTRQLSGGQQVQVVDVAPFVASPISGGQYALSISSASVTTLTVPATATHCWVSVDSGATSVRWTRDGTSPTTSVGHLIVAGDAIELDNLTSLRFRAVSGTSTIQVSYHRYV